MNPDVRIVLIETSHPGNIGAAARAMKNMELEELALVNPVVFPHAKATARASGAVGVLRDAQICTSLQEALEDCSRVYGTSARHRTIAWPEVNPHECAEEIVSANDDEKTAIVFGRERTGLTNNELDQCHKMLHIPCNPDFSSLNLAAAVQVVAYELIMARTNKVLAKQPTSLDKGSVPATQEQMNQFYEHLEQVITATEFFDPNNPRQLRRRLRRFFNRSAPDNAEVNILRGILTSVEKKIAN